MQITIESSPAILTLKAKADELQVIAAKAQEAFSLIDTALREAIAAESGYPVTSIMHAQFGEDGTLVTIKETEDDEQQ